MGFGPTAAVVAALVGALLTGPGCRKKHRGGGEAAPPAPPPVAVSILSIAPVSGPTGGGTAITITGTAFQGGATVAVGGSAATSVTVAGPTSITATTPPGTAGPASVVVTNPDATSATAANGFTYVAATAPPPAIAGLLPTFGPTAGGTLVTVTGSGFQTGATVTVGGASATSVTVLTAGSLTFVTPAGTAGPASVTITNPDAQSATATNGFTYGAPAPTVSAIAPASGPLAGGTLVTVTGTGFQAASSGTATVSIGGAACTGVQVVSGSRIVCTTPAGSAVGPANVVVTNPDSQTGTLANGYTYLGASPTLSAIAPTAGPNSGGTPVTLTGTNFYPGATVTVGGNVATTVTVAGATTITCVTPSVAPAIGPQSVVVTNADGQSATLAGGFNALGPTPTLTAVSPASGTTGGGTLVTLTGTNFFAGATITFGGALATSVTVTSTTSITCLTPAGTAGAATIVVTNADGQAATLGSGYTYVTGPSISSVSPNSGPAAGGTLVTITGTNFAGGATVTVGGSAATTVTVASTTTITCVTPAGAVGSASVTVTNPGPQATTLANGFTYLGGVPTIATVAPASGPLAGGTLVTITGTNFYAGATVTFAGALATSVTVVSSTSITCRTPAGTIGPAAVVVTNLDGQSATLASGFTYMGAAPTLASIAPTSGPSSGGTVVTLSGTNFYAGATVTIGGAAATVTSLSSTQIVATTGAGPVGPGNVVVTNLDGQSATLTNGFTYMGPAPTLASVSPSSGVNTGNVTITLTGTNFAAGATVLVGGVLATSPTFVSTTSFTAVTPNLWPATGAVAVTITNADGQFATLATGYTLTNSPPLLFTVSPAAGTAAGGAVVNVTGNYFQSGATVTIGGATVTIATFTTTTIVGTTPSGTVGLRSVVVTNPDSQTATLSNAYRYLGTPPTITSITPTSGPNSGGTTVTVTGTDFVSGATVDFEGFGSGGAVTFVSSTSLTCTTPNVFGGVGQANVAVVNPDGQYDTLPLAFTFLGPLPTISSLTPNSGTTGGGTLVRIDGSNYYTGSTVTFGGAAASGEYVTNGGNRIWCYTPPGTAGAVNVVVTNPDNQTATSTGGYTYTTGVGISSISPASGPNTGGTLVTITGTGFVSGTTVAIAGTAATSVTVVSATTVTALTPAGPLGPADVVVTVPGPATSTLPLGWTYGNGVNAQTGAYVFDTSAGVDCTRRWYFNMNHQSFLKDLQNRGLQSWGTPGDTTAVPAPLPLVDQYALDWMRAYVLRTTNIVYGRNPDGTKVAGASINVTFVGLAPASGARGCSTPASDWGEVCGGGCNPNGNGGPHPSASQSACNSGAIGAAYFDNTDMLPCNSKAEWTCNTTYHGCQTCGQGIGVFIGNIGNVWNQSLTGGRLTASDQQYLDGTTNSGTRYNQIHDFMKQFARRIAFVASHEIGHTMGLVGAGTWGVCNRSNGLCGATPAHNACCAGNLMAPSLSLGPSATDFSRVLDGNPQGGNTSPSCWTGGSSCWAMLQAFCGTSP
ncbi:MAG: IPT/TIG domain-containing protein [Planctomycetales bacterium]|nr:IPT/TIG domain-containing protein [Planctomycetales bacterium]